MEMLAGAVVSYLLGSIPTAYIVVKAVTGKNIWEVGSRNVGALNVKRATGSWFLSVLTLLADVLKAWIALYVVQSYFPSAMILAPFFIVLGHNYPIWTRFRGGRGIAVLLASGLYLDWKFSAIWAVLWVLGYILSGYIAVGAMAALLLTPVVEEILGWAVNPALLFALVPVWLKYREKADLLAEGKLPKHFWGGEK